MKRTLLLLALFAFATGGAPAFAAAPGDIGVFMDAAGTQTYGIIGPYLPFTMYVVVFDVSDIAAFEFSVTVDSRLANMGVTFPPQFGGYNFATQYTDMTNVIFGAGTCIPAMGPTVLMTQDFIALANDEFVFTIGASQPSSFNPPGPGYQDCSFALHWFGLAADGGGVYPDGSAVVNPTLMPPVAGKQESWGTVKALFR